MKTCTQKTKRKKLIGSTVIHVNGGQIRTNRKTGAINPVFTVKHGKENIKTNSVVIEGPSELIYSPDNPLHCGARAWIETLAPVKCNPSKLDSQLAHQKPDVSVNMVFVEYGYQVDIKIDGKSVHSECRDFGGSYKIKKLQQEFVAKILDLVEEFRKNK